MNWKDHITTDAQILAGKPIIKGTRISGELVLDMLARGFSIEQIVGQYPHLTSRDVHACVAYTASPNAK